MAETDTRAVHVIVHGIVQGVGFRYHTYQQATKLGVLGWVRNKNNGTVEAWVEGPTPAVDQMIEFLARGPGAALVDRVEVKDRTPEGHRSFDFSW